MKVVITGGSGFVGSFLVDKLVGLGHDVIIFDQVEPRWGSFVDARFVSGDIRNPIDVRNVVRGSHMVIHLAGLLGTNELVFNVSRAVEVNIGGSVNVMEACSEFNAKLIAISKPNCWINPYTITKIAMENFVEMYRKEFGLEAVIAKWFNVYAGRQPLFEESGYKKAVPTWIVSAIKGDPVVVYGSGMQTMDLIYVYDAISAIIAIMENFSQCEGKTFEIGSGVETVTDDLAKMIISLTESASEIQHIAMRPGEDEYTRIVADIEPLRALTLWKPCVALEEGMTHTISWYRENAK